MAQTEGTLTEMKEQILSNAMALYPHIVEKFTEEHDVMTAKQEDIFSVVTFIQEEEGEFRAHLTYGDGNLRNVVMAGDNKTSRSEALSSLLEATEYELTSKHFPSIYRLEERSKGYGNDKQLNLGINFIEERGRMNSIKKKRSRVS